jgi:hypothetical protein
VRDVRSARTPLRGRVFLAMLGEAALWAVCFGSLVGSVTSHVVGLVASKGVTTAIAGGWSASTILGSIGPGHPAAQGSPVANASTATKVMLALGAGVYEELVFRVLLVSGIAFIARRLLGRSPMVAAAVAVVLSALIFAAFHYIGPYGDTLRLDSFVFRLIGGLAFSLLYVMRGFGITAWTHALYDLLVFAG